MTTSQSYPAKSPPLDNISKRLTTLFVSILVAASSGTNYVFSAYGPQLASRLHIEQTRLNIIGLAGNAGAYSSSPIWGRIVDSRGPRIPLASALILLFTGYFGIRTLYNAGPSETDKPLSPHIFFALMVFSYMTGAGGIAGLSGAGNPTAKSFPDHMRATVTGLVLSGFGISAFIFSTIAHVAFPGDTSSFLLVLSIGTALPMLLGLSLIRTVPLQPAEQACLSDEDDDCQTPLLSHQAPSIARSILAEDNIPFKIEDIERDISGWALWTNSNFWCLFILNSILAGTGLMYINNVGSIARMLYAYESAPLFSKIDAAQWQAAQVSILSIMNCSGRVMIGLLSDYISTRLKRPRSYCYVLAAVLILLSQMAAANIDSVSKLWIATGLLGLGYGSVAAISPILAIDYFGLAHFSEASGYIGLSPLILGNAFSIMFGRNLDAHHTERAKSLNSNIDQFSDPIPKCTQGRSCYVDSLYMTIFACLVGVGVSLWVARRDWRREVRRRKRREEAAVWGIYVE